MGFVTDAPIDGDYSLWATIRECLGDVSAVRDLQRVLEARVDESDLVAFWKVAVALLSKPTFGGTLEPRPLLAASLWAQAVSLPACTYGNGGGRALCGHLPDCSLHWLSVVADRMPWIVQRSTLRRCGS